MREAPKAPLGSQGPLGHTAKRAGTLLRSLARADLQRTPHEPHEDEKEGARRKKVGVGPVCRATEPKIIACPDPEMVFRRHCESHRRRRLQWGCCGTARRGVRAPCRNLHRRKPRFASQVRCSATPVFRCSHLATNALIVETIRDTLLVPEVEKLVQSLIALPKKACNPVLHTW